jgi:hypothetical protein
MPRCWGPRSGHSPVSRHDDERLADLPARLGALLALVGAGPVERASETDRVAVEVGLAEGAELAPSGTGQDGQGQEHPPALVPLGGGGQQAAHLVVGGHPELGALETGGPGTFCRVAVEPAPAHRLAEGSGQHGVVPSDACCLEGPASALSGGKFAVPLVEVTGIQIDDPPVAELGVDHRLGRAPGVVKGPRGTPRAALWRSHSSIRERTVALPAPIGSLSASSSCHWRGLRCASVLFLAATNRLTWQGRPVSVSVPTKTRSCHLPRLRCRTVPVPLGRLQALVVSSTPEDMGQR